MTEITYDRQAAIEYAHRWAYGRNPNYLDFSGLGGDCTNYASQCVLAGCHGIMNYTPTFGWYYRTASHRTASWTGVKYFYNFITANRAAGPWASETDITGIEPGDIIQLQAEGETYHHTPVIVQILGSAGRRGLSDILVAAHSYDADYRPLSSYNARKIRFLHIEGVRAPGSGEDGPGQRPEGRPPPRPQRPIAPIFPRRRF